MQAGSSRVYQSGEWLGSILEVEGGYVEMQEAGVLQPSQ